MQSLVATQPQRPVVSASSHALSRPQPIGSNPNNALGQFVLNTGMLGRSELVLLKLLVIAARVEKACKGVQYL